VNFISVINTALQIKKGFEKQTIKSERSWQTGMITE